MHHVGQMSDPSTLSVKGYIQISQFSWFTHTNAHTTYEHIHLCLYLQLFCLYRIKSSIYQVDMYIYACVR